ncbi:MAG: hypothetical protein ACRDSP_22705 [Pseudonocardiaceae bacterium]
MRPRSQRRADRELRKRVRAELQALHIDPPLKVEVLCERLAASRGRPIHLVPYPIPVPGPFGLWICATDADWILYQLQTTAVHQAHIVLHEVGHILADHGSDDTDDTVWATLMPHIPPEVIRGALRRSGYDEAHEREAELVATIIQEWASVLDHVSPVMSGSAIERRLQGALGDRQGWL